MKAIERYRGSLLGLAIGDALGTSLEFREPGSFVPLTDMIGGGVFKLEPGQFTDDTSMALCLAESLTEKNGLNLTDQLERYCKWFKEGYYSSNGKCFDIGNTTRQALTNFLNSGKVSGSTDGNSLGNGSIMRLCPVPLFFAKDPVHSIEAAGQSSLTTHAHKVPVDACRYMAGLIAGAVRGASKEELLSERYCPVTSYWAENPLSPEIDEIACGSFKRKPPFEIVGSGFVVKSLEAAIWAFYTTDNFKDGVLAAVNLGHDADTTGAIYGQIAGAYYGIGEIPQNWQDKIYKKDEWILPLADRLYELSGLEK